MPVELTPALARAVDREMMAANDALGGEASTLEAIAAMTGLAASDVLRAEVVEQLTRARRAAQEVAGGQPSAVSISAGFVQGVAFATSLARVLERG